MKLLITGGAGFIGSNFLKYLIAEASQEISSIKVLDKLTYAGTLKNFSGITEDDFEFIHGDILNYELVQSAVQNVDFVINFAAESHVDRSLLTPRVFMETNVLGTHVLLDACLKNNVTRFLQISTDEVYGSIDKGAWSESSPIAPNSPYAASKASADLLALSYSRSFGLDVVVTRSSNNYGPNQFPEKIIPLFVTNILQGRKVPIYGDGKNVREWLHVKDNCRGIYLALKKGKTGEVYNIGSGKELENIELTRMILGEMGADPNFMLYVEDRKGHDFRYSLDYSKATREIGYVPRIEIEQGLKETIAWYRENENWWQALKSV